MSYDPQKVIREQQAAQRNQSWFLSKIHAFNEAHNKLKHTVHTAWRYPLPPWGRFVMGCVYFSIPVIAGYGISTWAVSLSEATVNERFSDTDKASVQGLGDQIVVQDDRSGTQVKQKVGAGGWGGGVNLATSDQETQDVNRVNLERFLRKQRRLKEKREREEARKREEQ